MLPAVNMLSMSVLEQQFLSIRDLMKKHEVSMTFSSNKCVLENYHLYHLIVLPMRFNLNLKTITAMMTTIVPMITTLTVQLVRNQFGHLFIDEGYVIEGCVIDVRIERWALSPMLW